jgi:hypothetical protein
MPKKKDSQGTIQRAKKFIQEDSNTRQKEALEKEKKRRAKIEKARLLRIENDAKSLAKSPDFISAKEQKTLEKNKKIMSNYGKKKK